MPLLSTLKSLLRLDRSHAPTVTRSNSPIQSWLRGEDVDAGNAALVSPFQQSVWVYTVVSALAQTVSAIPFRISRGDRSGETLVTKGPVIDLFNRPHQYLNRFRFWEFIVTWYCLRGEVFIVALDKSGAILPIRRAGRSPSPSRFPSPSGFPSPSHTGRGARGEGNGRGARGEGSFSSSSSSSSSIHSLLILPPDQFRHIVDGYDLAGWRFYSAPLSGPLPTQNFLPDEVIHDFLPNPYLFWRGMSPLSVAMLAAQTDYASAQFMKGLMLNNADTGVIVRTDQQLSEEQREQIKAALDARKRSAGTADRPLLLWGGTEIVKPTLSSADLQFLEHRKFNRQEICAAFFRMPQSLVGFTEDANRAIHQSERLNFIENSITPFCARLEATVEPIVKSFGQDLVGWFDMDSLPILQQARRDRVDTGVKLFALGYPANAINKSLDLGLPHLDWGDKGYLPFTLQEAGSGVEPAPSPDPNQQSASPIERLIGTLSQFAGALPLSSGDRAGVRAEFPSRSFQLETGNSKLETSTSPQPSTLNHQPTTASRYSAALQPRIKQKLSKLRSFFFAQRNRVLANLEHFTKALRSAEFIPQDQPSDGATESPSPSGFPSPSHTGRGVRGEGDGTGVRGEGSGEGSGMRASTHHLLFDPAEETKLLLQKLAPSFRADLELGFTMVGQELSFSDSSLTPEQVLAFLAEREKSLIQINQTTLKELTDSVLEGLRNHEAFNQLATRVKAVFQDAAERRAPAIAEIQTNSAVNAGRLLAMRAAKVQLKGWQTMDDEKVRPAHAQAEVAYAKGIPIDEPFIVGGEELLYPGDPHGSIGNIINCRCYSFPIRGDQ